MLPHQVNPTTRRVYEAIEQQYSLTGRSPGIRALRKLCGLKSTATIGHHIKRLEALGWVQRTPRAHYGVVPVRQPRVYYVRKDAPDIDPA